MAGDTFRHPAPYEECRLPTSGIPCKTTVVDMSLNSVGAMPSSLSPGSGSLSQYPCSLSNSAAMVSVSLCPCSLSLSICPCTSLIPSSVSSPLTPSAETQGDMLRILGADKDCSSSDESYIGQSNFIASSSSDETILWCLLPWGLATC